MQKRKPKTIEILSPGKNLFYAKEAIKCGADSIYIGAPKFSLRHEHGNSMQDIKELIEYAHKYYFTILLFYTISKEIFFFDFLYPFVCQLIVGL